ncbi:magnesium-dependent phosphatase-1 [Mycena amicta]|nr:magnesium-dependent phosphatase-1 [Mycena amicta]
MSADSESRLPKLVAFDLDYTLWDMWIETVTGPLRHRTKTNTVVDRHGTEAGLSGVLRREGVFVAACSRTHATHLAREALSLIRIPPGSDDESSIEEQPAIELFDNLQIYPGSKIAHFRALHDKTGIPYEEMLFFDDESRNREVERLGVTFYLTPDGVSNGVFEAGVKTWNVRRGRGAG